MALPVRIGAVRRLLKDVEASAGAERGMAVGGARELAAVLRRELARGAQPGAVREGDSPEDAAVLVYVLAHDRTAEDEHALRRARRARTPIVAVVAGPVAADVPIPWVLATHVVRVPPGQGFPIDRIAQVIAARLGEEGALLAARVPALRNAVCDGLTAKFARRNGLIGAAVFVPGADLPLLALNQLRLVLRIAQAYGEEVGEERLPEVAATLGVGFGLRALARQILVAVPVARWALQGAVAYAGTRAIGEAAVRRFETGTVTRQPA